MRHSWSFVGCDEGQEMYGVELYAAVRLAVVDEGLSHHEAGRRFGIDRRTVKKMLSYSAPPGYRRRHAVQQARNKPARSSKRATAKKAQPKSVQD